MHHSSGIMGVEKRRSSRASPAMDWILSSVTYHAVYEPSVMDAVRHALENGFAGVQLAVELPHLDIERMSDADLDRIAAFRAEHNLLVSVHAPDEAATLRGGSRQLARAALTYYGGLLNAAERIGAHAVVVHLGSAPRFRADDGTGRVMPAEAAGALRDDLRDDLLRLAGLGAGRCSVCVENVGLDETACETMEPLVREGYLHLCWDAAKAHTQEPRSPAARLFADYAYRIRLVHLHDVRDGKSHAALGTGEVNVKAAIEWLAPLDVREWCIEVRPVAAAADSLGYLRRLLSAEERSS